MQKLLVAAGERDCKILLGRHWPCSRHGAPRLFKSGWVSAMHTEYNCRMGSGDRTEATACARRMQRAETTIALRARRSLSGPCSGLCSLSSIGLDCLVPAGSAQTDMGYPSLSSKAIRTMLCCLHASTVLP